LSVDDPSPLWAGATDVELIGGREPRVVRIENYDPAWPARFRVLANRVREVLGDRALTVEHIGSTSVPGLAAKPIIDMLLTVSKVTDEAAYVPPLQSLGLGLRVREEDHRMLRPPQRDVHLHVYEPDSPEVRDYLDFRDWLRVSAADRALYEQTKRRLAGRRWGDMNDYAVAKTETVHAILTRARAWRAGQ
jgi:GrpB-like predicted nucleotidyltransferase (UPF0157 family)